MQEADPSRKVVPEQVHWEVDPIQKVVPEQVQGPAQVQPPIPEPVGLPDYPILYRMRRKPVGPSLLVPGLVLVPELAPELVLVRLPVVLVHLCRDLN